jgi:hypothetical protein
MCRIAANDNDVKRNIKRVTTYPRGFFDYAVKTAATTCDRYAGGQNDEEGMWLSE